jgi:hypothetical protein
MINLAQRKASVSGTNTILLGDTIDVPTLTLSRVSGVARYVVDTRDTSVTVTLDHATYAIKDQVTLQKAFSVGRVDYRIPGADLLMPDGTVDNAPYVENTPAEITLVKLSATQWVIQL